MAKRRGSRRLVAALLVAMIVIVGIGTAGYWFFAPYAASHGPVFVDIDRGMTTRQVARRLASRGIIRRPWSLLALRILSPGATLEAGEYRFSGAQTPWQVFQKLHRGDVFYEELTVPEGTNIFDIAGILDQMDTVSSRAFLKAARSSSIIHDLDPKATDLEGYLFPSTYRVDHHTTARQLCAMMTAEFRKHWASLQASRPDASTHDVVTLASMVEKETAIPAERPLVAAVFDNRLRAHMPLECDPTAVYAALLENRYRGVIHKSDLASANPFNTYAHAGLPPGPITNPGVASLEAALHPAATNYLYFVARPDGSGTHQFSETLTEHERAVLAYRKKSH